MIILKWYSIIWLSFSTIVTLWDCIKNRKLSSFLAVLVLIPIIIYLIIK